MDEDHAIVENDDDDNLETDNDEHTGVDGGADEAGVKQGDPTPPNLPGASD